MRAVFVACRCLIAIAVLTGCGRKDSPTPSAEPARMGSGSAATGSGSAADGTGSVGSGSADAKPDGAKQADGKPGDACAKACMLLKDTPLDAVRARCPDWSLSKDVTGDCEPIDFARNCIYATYGYSFKKQKYKQTFGREPWYKPDPGFSEASMSKPSRDNIAALKALAKACRGRAEHEISDKTRHTVMAWFAARRKGVPPLPDKLTDLDGKPIKKAAFVARYLKGKQRLFLKDPWEPIEFVHRQATAEVVSVSTGIPRSCTSSEAEDCEGFESITFTVDHGAIVAIDTAAAACPFVYERAGDTWAYRGEILRNLAAPAWATSQRLGLGGTICSATRTIRITEEKAERTYLDAVALAIDGAVVPPDACGDGAVCAPDGLYVELGKGDAIELTFTLPAASCDPGELIATGYYLRAPR